MKLVRRENKKRKCLYDLTLNCLACIYFSANPVTLSKGSKVIKLIHTCSPHRSL